METKRLILRRFVESDLDDLYEYLSDEEVVKFEPYRPKTKEETLIDLSFRINNKEMIAVERKEDHKLIGNLYYHKDGEEVEIGYIFNKKYWKRGYAKEACISILFAGFNKNVKKFVAKCDQLNESSYSLLESLGFGKTQELKHNTYFFLDESNNPVFKDTYVYELTYSNFIYKRIKDNEENFISLFSKKYVLDEGLIRYYDDDLKEMYDHNFFVSKDYVDDDVLDVIETFKELRGENHIKILSQEEIPLLESKGFEKGIMLTMVKLDYFNFDSMINHNIVIKNFHSEDISSDLLNLELFNYGTNYGEDFIKEKMPRYTSKAKEDNSLNYFAAYFNDEIVSSCYAYFDNGVVAVDDLTTKEKYRHQHIATTLLTYIGKYYQSPIYLHADNDDTPKDMYKKLGFIQINKTYEYFKLNKKD